MMRRQPGHLRIRQTQKQLPLLGSNQDSPDPVPLRLAPPLAAFVVWTVPSPAPSRGQVVPAPVSTPSPLGAWLGVASQGPPTSRTCTHAVSDVVSGLLPESGVSPITPRGSVPLVVCTQVTARSRFGIRTWFTSSRGERPGTCNSALRSALSLSGSPAHNSASPAPAPCSPSSPPRRTARPAAPGRS